MTEAHKTTATKMRKPFFTEICKFYPNNREKKKSRKLHVCTLVVRKTWATFMCKYTDNCVSKG